MIFDHDAELVADVARFVADGLDHGERVVVVATPEHRAALDEVLVQYGEDTARAAATGRYLVLDAADSLDRLLVDGRLDRDTFLATVGTLVDAAADDGTPVRLYGEMVNVLWEHGDVAGALQLETWWNHLSQLQHFALLCGYPAHALATASLGEITDVCALHSAVTPPRSYTARADEPAERADHCEQVFVPVTPAVPAARRFVTSTLRHWGAEDAVDDAALIASELATNAVGHAGSAFRLAVTRDDGAVRITVEDAAPLPPRPRDAAPTDFNGRGLALIAEVAERWGHQPVSGGKVVWAELGVADGAATLGR